MELFIPPDVLNIPQLLFMTVVYGVILYQSSQLIASGSELLLLFPSVAGLVGSIVLPILGAVPDGTMVLFSGLGPDAQNQVSVGVGALAGSTVMLLTFPWFIAVFFGRVPLDEKRQPKYGSSDATLKGLLDGGVSFQESLQKAAKIMLGTTLLFLVIQLPATFEEVSGISSTSKQAGTENMWALLGFILCVAAFCGYLYICYKDANEDKALAKVIEGIKHREISIGAALKFAKDTSPTGKSSEPLCAQAEARLKKLVWPFFVRYDADGNHKLDISEFKTLLHDLGEKPSPQADQMLKKRDVDNDGKLDLDEVVKFLDAYLEENLKKIETTMHRCTRYMPKMEEDDEPEEVPEDLADLTPDQQFKRLLIRSCWMMGLGTFLVLIFSDPMVDVLSNWGVRLGISPFYISFILAPFASNASELLSAYTYAVKKSQKSMTTSLSTLIGAACMNNTFCLAVFLALVYCKSLAWQFTAETLAIVVIQWVIGGLVIATNVQTTPMAFLILACYPGCLFIVWFFENIVGWD
eukprot:CAMPEP_0204586272 /NCGR_PEP_ID=MMETSP0661-20131031/47396_1 /ASSEMBLY_ACC=CAM_ASM_000606 /TAXON_ID=109239 /ORGANISM="Alexandrium margalefi, Strain AMGDE01CS-322" /LENGTH=522 /DNA_ID=CAMNT_0051595899 /DNA_START=64 /DNA_END=1632 /DNA_ORIENTATION=-